MRGAIVHFEPIFSKWDQSIFLNRTLKRIKSEIIVENMTIPLYLLPVYIDTPSEKAVKKFIHYLKEEKIKKVFLTEAVKKLHCCQKLKDYFFVYDGKSIINYYLIDILKKCSFDKEIPLEECTLVIKTHSPEQVKDILISCCPYVKDICIDTSDPEAFEELRQFILESYGVYISFSYNKSLNNIILSPEKIEIVFQNKKLLKDFLPFIECNSELLELFIEKKFNSTKRQYIQQFHKDYPMVITKIKNKD